MTGLLDLPDELLIKILSYLRRPYWPFVEPRSNKEQRRDLSLLNKRLSELVFAEWIYNHIPASHDLRNLSCYTRKPGCQHLGREISWEVPYDEPKESFDRALSTLIQAITYLFSVSIASYEPEDIQYLGRDPNLLPLSLASLKLQHPGITRLQVVISSLDLALALLEHLFNLEDITFRTHYLSAGNIATLTKQKEELFHTLCRLRKLRRLVWEGVDIFEVSAGPAALAVWTEHASAAPLSESVRILEFGDYDPNYGNDHAMFWQASALAFPHLTSLRLDVIHMQYLAKSTFFPRLNHLAVEDVCMTMIRIAYTDTNEQLDQLEGILSEWQYFDSAFLRHSTVSRLRIASSLAAYLLVKDDRYFPALRFLTISASSERWLLGKTPLLCARIKQHCGRRGVRLFEEVELDGKDLLFEYTLKEIHCSAI